MNGKTVEIWWLLQAFTITVISSMEWQITNITEYCTEFKALQPPYETHYECREHGNETKGTIGVEKFGNSVALSCTNYYNPGYWKLIRNLPINDKEIDEFRIVSCPLPNASYFNIFNTFDASLVKRLKLNHVVASAGSVSAVLEPYHFEKIGSLNRLIIMRSPDIKELPEKIFKDLVNLDHLSLFGNKLQTLPANTFKGLESLKTLILDCNNFTSFHEDLFKPLLNLDTLALGENKLDRLPKDLFSSQSKLTCLRMQNNNIKTLQEGIFDGLINLSELSLNFNQLADPPKKLLARNSNLTNVSMRSAFDNRTSTLPPRFFAGLKKLYNVNLSRNKLASLPEDLFFDTTHLEVLDISHNQLTDFGTIIIGKATKLRELNLSHNNLTSNGRGVLEGGCVNLNRINLRNNSLTKIAENWKVMFCTDVTSLDLSYNKFKSLTTDDFNFNMSTNENVTINLSSNEIDHIEMDLDKLREYQDPKKPVVKFIIKNNPINCSCRALNLTKHLQDTSNKIIYISPDNVLCDAPEGLRNKSLKDLALKNFKCPINQDCPNNGNKTCSCYYRSVDETIEVNCTSVGMHEFPSKLPDVTDMCANPSYELIFANNEMELMDELQNLANRSNITGLDVSHNKLSNIEDVVFLTKLKFLDVSHNNVAQLSEQLIKTFSSNPNLASMKLHENPWHCDCNTRYLSKFIRNNMSLFPPGYDITCKKNNYSISGLTEEILCFKKPPVDIIFIVLAVVSIIAMVLVILWYKYEMEIKVWMYARPLFRRLVTEKEIDKNKPYDAFIVVSHKDLDFVDKKLIPELENGDPKYKLCVYHRDFLPGEWISQQIVESICNSKRTLVVLSSNFFESSWSMYEFRMALAQQKDDHRNRIIIIMLEEVTKYKELDMYADLKRFLTMNIYLKWDETNFWDRLRYALPHPQTKVKQTECEVVERQPVNHSEEINNVPDSVKFDETKESFDEFCDRLVRYFASKKVPGDDEVTKKQTFISALEPKHLTWLEELIHPSTINTKTFNELKEVLGKHLALEPSTQNSRQKFLYRTQGERESIREYIDKLRRLAQNCEYPESMLNTRLRDVFVSGLRLKKIQDRLLQEGDTSLENMLRVAEAIERKYETDWHHLTFWEKLKRVFRLLNIFRQHNRQSEIDMIDIDEPSSIRPEE